MYQIRIYLLIAVFGFLSTALEAQFNPFGASGIENFHYLETGGGDQFWCITKDHRGVVYAGNNDHGLIEFDGSTWRIIPGTEEQSVRSLVTGKDGVVYAGLEGDFGRLEPDISGNLQFRSLVSDSLKQSYPDFIIWKSHYGNDRVYFCAMEVIFVFTPSTGHLELLKTPIHGFFTYLIGEDLYTSDFGSGLMRYEGGIFVPISGGEFFIGKDVFDLVQIGPEQLIIGLRDEGVVLFDLQQGKVDSSFLREGLKAELASAWLLNLMILDERILIGTYNSGLYVLDMQGNIIEVIGQRQGLINQTIAHVYADPHSQSKPALWIAHWKGISRIELNNPFSRIPLGRTRMGMGGRGSDETIFDITAFGGELFISTRSGLQKVSRGSGMFRIRPIQAINESILDLQLISPAPGDTFLLASAWEQIFVIDQNQKIKKLTGAGGTMLVDPKNPDIFYVAGSDLAGFQYKSGNWEEIFHLELEGLARQIAMDHLGSIWISGSEGLLRVDSLHAGKGPRLVGNLENGLPADNGFSLFSDPESGGLLLGSSKGIYHFDYMRDSMVYDSLYNSLLPEGNNNVLKVYHKGDGPYWFSFENQYSGWNILGADRTGSGFEIRHERAFRALAPGIATEVFYTDSSNRLCFSRSNELNQFNEAYTSEKRYNIKVLMRKVTIPGDSALFSGTHYFTDISGLRKSRADQSKEEVPGIEYKFRDITFHWSSPYFKHRRQINYSYYLEGFSKEWSHWGRDRSAKFTNLPNGRYEMLIKARNVYGDESPTASYSFTILRPWYATLTAISLYLLLIASLTFTIIRYTRGLRRRAEVLVRKNEEIELQKRELENLNEEITAQRDEIETQRDSITIQKELIDTQKTAMTDSLHYAKRIQDAVLPAKEVMRFLLPKHFVFYRPRDIVSGDFFWVDKKDERILLAVADCTGHGVPGAFMSMLGISLLNEIASKLSDHPINEIMDELRDRVIFSLGQTGDKYETRDGIEMGLLAINPDTREIQYTGANMNLYTFQKGELAVIKGDRMPVGIHSEGNTFFSITKKKMNRGDTLYLFSDGYPDQFGGTVRKKYGSARLKTLLTNIQQNIMHDQKAAVAGEFDSWKGDEDQIDDVLMVGIKL